VWQVGFHKFVKKLMRKQLLALLSMIGLAGGNVPAGAHVLKGASGEKDKERKHD
jgi:hypothetical protein